MSELLSRWFVLMFDVSLKALLLAGVTGLLLTGLRVRNSSVKHAAWFGVLVSLISLPLLSSVIPSIPVPWPFPVDQSTLAAPDFPPTGSIESSLIPPVVIVDQNAIQRDASPDGSVNIDPMRSSQHDDLDVPMSAIDAANTTLNKIESSATAFNGARSQTAFGAKTLLPLFGLIWGIGTLLLCMRLLQSIRLTRRLVHRSTLIQKVELRRNPASSILNTPLSKVTFRESPLTFVPLTTGWCRPTILLPTSWHNWSEDKLANVLIHELTHVHRGDCWTVLLMEVVLCFYWFHPLTWWLKRQLAVLAEECCDDAAIVTTGNRASYARHLLEIATVLCERKHRMNYVGLAMARRSQVEHRILAILDPNRPLSYRLTRYTFLLLFVVSVPLVAIAAALKPGSEATAQIEAEKPGAVTANEDKAKNGQPFAATSPAAKDQVKDSQTIVTNQKSDVADAKLVAANDQPAVTTMDFRLHGHVTDTHENPIRRAKIEISAVKYPRWSSGRARGRIIATATTDADGRYEYLIPADQLPKRFLLTNVNEPPDYEWLQVAASSPGRGVDIQIFHQTHAEKGLNLKLIDDEIVHGRVLNLEGRPVAGADVSVVNLYYAEAAKIDAWYSRAVEEQGRDWDEHELLFGRGRMGMKGKRDASAGSTFEGGIFISPASLPSAKTDVEGKFTLTGLGRDRMVIAEISGPNLVRSLINIVTRPMKPVRDFSEGSQLSTGIRTFYGSEFDYIASPSVVVQGVVRDMDTKQPLADVIVTTESISGTLMARAGFITTTTDAEGRYRIEGLPPTKGNRLEVIPAQQRYLKTGNFEVPESPSLQPVTLDIELRKAVWITGRVFDKSNGKPVQAKLGYSPFATNPFTKNYWQYSDQVYSIAENVADCYTDEHGRFRIPVIPGRGVLAAKCYGGGFIAGYGREQIEEYKGDKPPSPQVTCDALEPSWFHSLKEIDPAADATEIEIDLPVDRGSSVALTIIDPEGNPVPKVYATGVDQPGLQHRSQSHQTTLSGLVTGKPVIMWFRQQGWNQGEKPLEKIQVITPNTNDDSAVVQMERLAHVSGRLVDTAGKPLPPEQLSIWYEINGGEPHHIIVDGTTDTEGHFEIDIPVGGKYRLTSSKKGKFIILVEHLEPRPAEVIDLGDVIGIEKK